MPSFSSVISTLSNTTGYSQIDVDIKNLELLHITGGTINRKSMYNYITNTGSVSSGSRDIVGNYGSSVTNLAMLPNSDSLIYDEANLLKVFSRAATLTSLPDPEVQM